MLKKIDVKELRVGMYVHELDSSWINTPFWQKSFMLEDKATLATVWKTGIRHAWIDTGKGQDIPVALDAVLAASPSVEEKIPVTEVSKRAAVSLHEELGRAAQIVNKSREAVFSMFNEARMGKAVDAEEAMPLVEEITASVIRNQDALIGLARLKSKDDYTYMHSVAVCALMVALAKQLRLSPQETRDAGVAGLLHDIGKMAVPVTILSKPGKLTDAEFRSVKAHPEAGYKMLQGGIGVSEAAMDVCLHHHEKMDGTGYPHGLKGEEISLVARMGAVCDVYDAITSDRPYKQGWCPADSLRKMAEWSKNKHFDERVFQAFVKSIGIYPCGTLVRLESGRLGVVVEQQVGKSLLQPKVRVFFSSKSMTYIVPELLDLAGPGVQDKIAAREDAAKWGLTDIQRFWLGEAAELVH
ncbi:HD-GYP domain-containing protein [Undibacterium sp. TJN25]|uniref:HD-GYP domain-containing protein n=1 Tax=Undibacterium sp. TJN25 TaxID=3413056 RepID=UPI003BF3592D